MATIASDGHAEGGEEPIPISALQHVVYCLRQAALIHLEQLWAENQSTAEGRILHINADKPGARRQRGVRRVTGLPVASARLRVAGIADLVEFMPGDQGEQPYPVEFKRGKLKRHRADEVQLCAQALCLEEMSGRAVPEGALYYAQTRKRVAVAIDDELRRLTEEAIAAFGAVLAARKTPPPTAIKSRCRNCSLSELCRPDIAGKDVRGWRRRMIARSLDGAAGEEAS